MGDLADDMYDLEVQAACEAFLNEAYPGRVETLNLGTIRVHGEIECMGRHCVIHNPSDHPLQDAPLLWRSDKGIMERVCKHGVGHDDADDLAYRKLMGYESSGIHGCCAENCCTERTES